MFPFANMVYFLPDEFSGLRAGRFSFQRILARPFDGFFLRHVSSFMRWEAISAPLES
jgi:hypothetical protein